MSYSDKPPRPDAVLFDWDNTLIDSWAVIHDALNITFEAMEHPLWTLEETRQQVTRSLRESFPEMFKDRWEEARDVFYARYQEIHLTELNALPGAEDLIAALLEAGIYLGVVSNKAGPHLRTEAAHLGWDGKFSKLVGATDASRDKPAVEPVALALENSGITPGPSVWFVGDTDVDMECAHRSDCVPILIRAEAPKINEFDPYIPRYHFQGCEHLAILARNL